MLPLMSLELKLPIIFIIWHSHHIETKEEMEQCMADIKSNANKVRRKLKQIEKNIDENSSTAKPADIRIQKTQVYLVSSVKACSIICQGWMVGYCLT